MQASSLLAFTVSLLAISSLFPLAAANSAGDRENIARACVRRSRVSAGHHSTGAAGSHNSTAKSTSIHTSSKVRHTTTSSQTFSGPGTEWGGNWSGGNCGFSAWTQPSQYHEVAMNSANWDSSGACGACVEITGPTGRKATAIVGDQCPSCEGDGLDMDPELFPLVQAKGASAWTVIPVSWKYVPCKFTSPLILINKEGVTKYWVSLQVARATERVSALDISIDGGKTWISTTRQSSDNFFQPDTWPTPSATGIVRVRCVNGKTITTKNVTFLGGVQVTASGNC